MSVSLTFLLLRLIAEPRSIGAGGAVLLFLGEMAGVPHSAWRAAGCSRNR
jgi:hypothetical protein